VNTDGSNLNIGELGVDNLDDLDVGEFGKSSMDNIHKNR